MVRPTHQETTTREKIASCLVFNVAHGGAPELVGGRESEKETWIKAFLVVCEGRREGGRVEWLHVLRID